MSRRKTIAVVALVLVAVFVTFASLGPRVSSLFDTAGASLGSSSSTYAGSRAAGAPAAPAAGAPAARSVGEAGRAADATAALAVAGQAPPAQPLPGLDRLVIRNVSMTLVTPNVRDVYYLVEQIAAEQGGLIAGSQIRQEGDHTVANITLRVPADSRTYQTTVERLRAIADRVVDEQSQVQDVTEEHVDLESRLRNLHLTEQRLLALYDKANRLEEIYGLQRELTNIRGQIEQAQGRKNALERRAAMTTITLQIREPVGLPPRHRDWSPADVLGQALGALAVVFRGLTTVAIWALVLLPIYGAPILLLWLLRNRLRALLGPSRSAPA